MWNEHDIEDNVAPALLMVFGSDDLGGATFQSDSLLTHTLSKSNDFGIFWFKALFTF